MFRYLLVVSVLICFLASLPLAGEARKGEARKEESWVDKVIKYLKPPEKPAPKPVIARWNPVAHTIYLGTEKCCAVVVPPAPPKYPVGIKPPVRRPYRAVMSVWWGTMTGLPSTLR